MRTLKINSQRNSKCDTADLKDLDFQNWWTDTSWGMTYLQVEHKLGWRENGVHRVYCKHEDSPRIRVKNGIPHWLVENKKEAKT